MITLDYKDWFINQKRIPDKQSVEATPFFELHKKICLEGCMVNNVFFNPFLYWHLNMWHTDVDVIDENGFTSIKYTNPTFRDNEWLTTNAIWDAIKEKKGLAIGGIRRFSKTVQEASYIGWGATLDENSQNVIAGLNSPDIKLITDKLDKGLNFLPWYYKWDRIEDNWGKQVTLGVKTKTGTRFPFSSILIRNLDDGTNEEAIAGTKPRKLIIDEGGKGSFLKALQAAIPGFTTPFGWGCSPIVTFTGGDMTKFNDAKQLMFDVSAFNFLEFKNEDDDKRVHGLFIGHKYRLEAKKQSTFGKFIQADENSTLHDIPMMVSDEALAEEITNKNLEKAKKATDRSIYLKEKMYYPKKVDDIFLNVGDTIFDRELALKQKARIMSMVQKPGMNVFLSHNGEKIVHEFTDKQPILNYPIKGSDDKDAPVVIYEFPMENPPYGLYIAGVDSYREGKAKYSDSLGSVYIYKRINSITGEGYQNMIVASYSARPDKKSKWEAQARLLIKYYNARTLIENDEISFIEHLKAKGDSHYMERQPQWLKEIIPNTTVEREFGISRTAEKVRTFLHAELKKYMEEPIYIDKAEDGNVKNEVLGITRIYDIGLLEEIINYTDDANVDRIVAFELALALASKLDPLMGSVGSVNNDTRFISYFNKKSKKFNKLSK